MVSYRNRSTVSFTRYITRETGASVLAFQFPEEGIEHLRKLWQQPEAQPGDWLVKVGIGCAAAPKLKLRSDEKFHERFRLPVKRTGPIILETEETWNDKYSHLFSGEIPSDLHQSRSFRPGIFVQVRFRADRERLVRRSRAVRGLHPGMR